jgi:hypothetical protein
MLRRGTLMVIDTHLCQTARIPCVGSSPSHGLRLLSRILPEANVQETAVSGSPRPATTDHHEPSPISQEGNWEMHRGRTLTSPGMTWHDPESPSLVIHSHPESLALVPYCAAMACPVLGIGTLDAEHIPPCSRQAPAVCRFPWVLLPGRCSGGFYLLLAVSSYREANLRRSGSGLLVARQSSPSQVPSLTDAFMDKGRDASSSDELPIQVNGDRNIYLGTVHAWQSPSPTS